MYNAASSGNQIGNPITQTVPITNGLFTTQLNASNEFGATAFNGDARWLEIRVSNACPSAGSFTTLTPREPITPAPYALHVLNASEVLGVSIVPGINDIPITSTQKTLTAITSTTGTTVFYQYSVGYHVMACSTATIFTVKLYVDGVYQDISEAEQDGATGCAGHSSVITQFGLLSTTATTHIFEIRADSDGAYGYAWVKWGSARIMIMNK